MLRNDDAAFSGYSSYLLYHSYRFEKSHCTKRDLIILRISLSEFRLNNDNGIRKVRLGMDIFDKRILNSCKFISDTVLLNMALSTAIFSLQPTEYKPMFSLQPTEYKPVSECMVHNLSRFYFLCFHFPCFWQDGTVKEETLPSLHYYFLFSKNTKLQINR